MARGTGRHLWIRCITGISCAGVVLRAGQGKIFRDFYVLFTIAAHSVGMMVQAQQNADKGCRTVPELLRGRARDLERLGDEPAARAAYVRLLELDPTDHDALIALGTLAAASGFRAAARTVFAQAVQCHPGSAVARVGFAEALIEAAEFEQAAAQGRVALRLQPGLAAAHRVMARCLDAQGDVRAAAHRYLGFRRHPVIPPRGPVAGRKRALLLVAARGGNIGMQGWFDPAIWAVSVAYADYLPADLWLGDYDLVVNAIGDADFADAALADLARRIAACAVPVINAPAAVRDTGRVAVARRLAGLPGVVVPRVRSVSRQEAEAIPEFPMLLRVPGYHTGQYFERADDGCGLQNALRRLPGNDLLAIDYVETRNADGFWRKYRVLIIEGVIYPVHLAVSDHWKVHYFSAPMADSQAHRAEDRRFITDMAGVLGAGAMNALSAIGRELGLDYVGVDFARREDGSILVFEANATMVAPAPPFEPIGARSIWDYRRPAIRSITRAVQAMLQRRCAADLSHARSGVMERAS